jgi:hypothetical protein
MDTSFCVGIDAGRGDGFADGIITAFLTTGFLTTGFLITVFAAGFLTAEKDGVVGSTRVKIRIQAV